MSVDYKGIDEKNVQDAIDAVLVEATDIAEDAAADVIEDAIVNAVVDKAPSQNAVFDALALKANSSDIEDALVDGVTTKAPSQNVVFDALALKLDIADLVVIDTAASAGGGAVESVAAVGLAAGDVILACSQKTAGANSTALVSFNQAVDAITLTWSSSINGVGG